MDQYGTSFTTVSQAVRQKPAFKPPNQNMERLSTYRNDFLENKIIVDKPTKRRSKTSTLQTTPKKCSDCDVCKSRQAAFDARGTKTLVERMAAKFGFPTSVLEEAFNKQQLKKRSKARKFCMPVIGKKRPQDLYNPKYMRQLKLEGKSTTTKDYQPKILDFHEYMKSKKLPWLSRKKKDDESLVGEPSPPPPPKKPEAVKKSQPVVRFFGKSGYKADFPPHPVKPRPKDMPWVPSRTFRKPCIPFAGASTYKRDYIWPFQRQFVEESDLGSAIGVGSSCHSEFNKSLKKSVTFANTPMVGKAREDKSNATA